MIKIEKDISIYREILKDSDLTAVERKAIYRRIDSLLQELESIKLEKAVANLGAMCKHIDEGKRPLPWGRSQTRL
jgi:hypothetical protein